MLISQIPDIAPAKPTIAVCSWRTASDGGRNLALGLDIDAQHHPKDLFHRFIHQQQILRCKHLVMRRR